MLDIKSITSELVFKYGVTIFEDFYITIDDNQIENDGFIYRFTLESLQKRKIDEPETNFVEAGNEYCKLLREKCNIVPIKFIPKQGQRYFYIEWGSNTKDAYVTQETWDGGSLDYMNLKMGNVFKSVQGARSNMKKVINTIIDGKY